MAAPKKKIPAGGEGGSTESAARKLAIAELKVECLRGLGLRNKGLDSLLQEAKNALRTKGPGDAGNLADRLLVLFSIAAAELEEVVSRFLGGEDAPAAGSRGPSLGQIEKTVSDAFGKALHSTSLRRMVEVVAVEKIRSVLADEGLPKAWIAGAVREALEEAGFGAETKRKRNAT